MTWDIVFCNAECGEPIGRKERLLKWFLSQLKPGFQHCYAMRPVGRGLWLIVNPTQSLLRVDVRPLSPQDEVALLLAQHRLAEADEWPLWRLRGVYSCVGTVKQLLGIQAPWIWTPWQLYRYLGKV